MPITFLDEKDKIAPAAPKTGKRRITFLDEEEPTTEEAVKPEPEILTTQSGRKITFFNEEPTAPVSRLPQLPPSPKTPKFEPVVETIGQLEGIKNAAMNAFDSSRQNIAVAGGVSPEEAEQISQLEYQKEARKVSPAYSEYLQAEGMDAVKAFAKNPFEITTNIITEGLAGSLYSLGAGVAAGGVAAAATAATGVGAPLAPAAFLGGQIGGTFAGSLATEYGGKVLEELQNAGMDIKDPESIQKFFGDEKLMDGARSQALKRGVPVAIFDGVSAGIGGRLARLPVQALTKTPTRLAVTEGVTQAALGGGGEIAGAVAAGEEIQPKAVFAEVIGEAGPAAAEITVGRIAERMARTPEQKKLDQTVLATQVATRASQDVAPATADAVERQVQDTLAATAETPEQRVARLQREAQEASGIELEEEPPVSGLPPERIKSARWFESASRNRLKELQDKDDAGVEDFTTQERDEFEFLKTNPTPEQVAQRYGYGVAPAVEPTAVTTTTPPTTPTVTEPEPTLTPPPATPEPAGVAIADQPSPNLPPRADAPTEPRPTRQEGESRQDFTDRRDAWDEQYGDMKRGGRTHNEDGTPYQPTVLNETMAQVGTSGVLSDEDTMAAAIGTRSEILAGQEVGKLLNNGWVWDATQNRMVNPANPEQRPIDAIAEINQRAEGVTPITPTPTTPTPTTPATPTPVTPPPVTPEVPIAVEPPALAPLRRVVKAEQTEDDVSGLVGQGLVELYNGQPVITQAGLETLPETERPRLTPEARKIQIDTRTSEAAAEAISKNLRIGVDQVPADVTMPAGWTLAGDIYIPPVVEAAPEARGVVAGVVGAPAEAARNRQLENALDSGDLQTAQSLAESGATMDRATFLRSITPAATQRATTIHTRLERDGIINKEEFSEGRGLVYGDGRGRASTDLGAESYEPFPPSGFTPNYTGDRVAGEGAPIDKKFRTILNTFVLNVVDPETRAFVVRDIANLLENGGRAVFVTRGKDVASSKALVSFGPLERIQRSEGKLTYQKGFAQPELIQYLQETLGDGFEVRALRGGSASDVRVEVVKNTDATLDNPPIVPEARGTVAGIVGEPTVRAYENQQSQNRSRLEKEVAAVPSPTWGTTQDQKRNSIVGFRDQWVGRWNNVLGRAGLSVRVDQRPVDEAGNKWKGTSRVQIQPDGQLSVVVGRGTEELALRQGDQEVPAKQRVALDVEEEVVHAIYLSQVLAAWDKRGDAVDYVNRVLSEKTQKIRETVGDNVFRTLVNDTLRSYYKEIISPDLIGVLTQRVIDGNEAESFTFLNELARMVAQKNVRGITQEEVYYSIVEQARQWVAELLNSIRQFTTNYNLLGTEFAADMDGLIKEYQALADVMATPEAIKDRVSIQLKGKPDPEIGQRVSIKDKEGKEIGNIFFKERAYLSGSGFPLVNEFHIGFKRKYQGMGYFADAVKSLLRKSPNPIFIVSSRVVNNNVFKAIDNLDRSVFDVKELDRGFLITLKPEAIAPRGVVQGVVPAPTFTEESPEAKTLSNLKASMEKVDAASDTKGGKPETQKVSEIAANWMDSGGDERALQDAITENTNLSPVNAAKVAKVIAKQYDIQQSIATAFLETQTGLSVEALPEGVTLPKEVDPDRPKPVMQRLFDVFMGVRVPPVKIQVNEKTALKQQIRLKAAANRAAKAEQKRTAEEVVEIIKAMELLGPVRPKQVQALAKRAARVIWTNEKSVEAFSEYAAKVVENANYDADLREAKDAQKRAKQLSTQKKVAMGPQREVLEDVSKVPVNKLDDPRMFSEAVNYYLRGFKAVLSPDYVVIPDAEMESYLSGAQSETQRNQRDLDREANRRLAEKYGIDPDQVNEMMESIDIIKQIEAQENRDALENLLTEKAVETQQGLRGYDTDGLRADQRSIVSSMLKVDPKALDPEERQRFIRITNNIIYNNQTNGAEYFVAVAKGQQSAREAAQDSTMVAKNRAWINLLPRFVSERMQRGWALELQSISDTFRNAFGKGAMAKMYDAMGMLDLNLGFTKANNTIDKIQEKIAEFHRNLEKKYKAAARNQDGLLAEGVVGFLIQSVPKKDEVSSINQRRDLIRQDIANRKGATGEPDRVAMAGRIEAILNQIDGDSVEAILDNMKREFPANHESLVWYKDTLLPQYKDFLKGFDENFNDQANNYENPNYLTIGFTSAGPSLAITPEEQGMFYDQVSLRPKQSAYTIKRVDYTKLPTDRTTKKPKEIEFNLRRNVFNGLSDQINKAYTSSGWQRIASFMKTPEAEVVFGGAANKDFFIERLNRLRLSRMRRGSMGSGGAIEKAVDSLSVISRKLGTGIALGGIYQWIKQPPDQLITAWGSGGRGDLLAKNIAPSTQKAARELLNKFSIGRRGDASSGYKYINQMEGHQNRLERYFSESKWDQAKEQAGKIADVWMIALKSSDFLAASAAWMTYYEGELNKQDIKIDDWSKEASLIESDPKRRQAAAFAEQMTDIYQGSSDPTSMATFAQSGKTGWENLVKAIFVPFNSFAIQQRMRLYSDARDAINGSKGGAGGLAGTIGGLVLFHMTKRYAIPAISGAGIGVLYGLMGVDMDEPDEEKQKEEANKNWRQFLADITGNLLVGGTPQILESQFIDAMNRASYLVSLQLENDSILNDDGEIMSYDQYSKERSPFYRYKSYDNAMSLGMLEIGLGQAEQVALQTKMLATPEEMEMYTPEEQRLLYFSALSEWLLLMRLNDTDFARLVGKARRDMIKAAEEREKEIKRIRSGR